MEINVTKEGTHLTVATAGELDINSAPLLEKDIKDNMEGIKVLTLDFEGLEYVSSAGLRVLLIVKKLMGSKGDLEIVNVNNKVMEIMDVTGFSKILSLQPPKA